MSQNARAQVTVVIAGEAKSLDEALKHAQSSLKGFGAAAAIASEQAGTKLAAGEAKAAHEAQSLGRQARATAEMVGMLGAESSEAVLKVQGLSHAFGEMHESMGGLRGAILGGIGAMAAFGALDFLKESVSEAMKGEAAWARLTAAYRGNADGLREVKATIEDTRATWEKLGYTQAQVADMAGRARGMGLDPAKVLGDPAALADTAKVLGSDIPSALDAISRPRGGMQVLGRLGLSKEQIQQAVAQMKFMNAAQRVAFIEQQVEASRFAGQGMADTGTASGKFKAFNTALADLREEVGTSLIPALTQLATALTGLLQGADALSKPWGGLANVLKVLFIPMLAGGLLLFTNLRGIMTRLVDVLLGRLVGAFGQTAEGLAGADSEARQLADDLHAIPELVTTTASFIPATAVKDAYKANIQSIPRDWTTTATFVPAGVTEPHATGIIDGWSEPAAVPVSTRGIITGWSEPAAVPVRTTGTVTGWSEAAAVPVRTTGRITSWAEAAAVPVKTTGRVTGWAEAAAVPVRTTGIISGWVETAATPPAPVRGKIGSWAEAAATPPAPVRGTISSWTEARPGAVSTTGTITGLTTGKGVTLHVTGGTIGVEPVLARDWETRINGIRVRAVHDLGWVGLPVALVRDDKALAHEAQQIRTLARADLALGGPIPVKVRPEWVSNAAEGLKSGLAMGAGIAITDAIFNSVTIKHVAGLAPPAAGTIPGVKPGGGTQSVTISGTPHTYVTNVGAIGEALAGKVPHSVSITGHPYVGLQPNQSVGISNVPTVKISATTPIQTTTTLPKTINVTAHQGGHWQISLAPDALKRFGEMVGEIALGTMLGNVFMNLIGKIPFGKIVELIRGLFKGHGGKGGGDGEPPIPLLPQWSQSTQADMLGQLLAHEGVPLERSLVPVLESLGTGGGGGSTFIVTGLVNAVKAVPWGTVLASALKVGAVAATVAVGILAMFKTVFGAIGGALTNPHSAIINVSAQVAPFVARIGATMLQALVDAFNGIKKALSAWIGNFIKSLLPHVGGSGSASGGGGSSGFGGLSHINPATLATLRDIVSGSGGASTGATPRSGAGAVYHQTYNATFHIDGAQDPVTISRQINRAFSEFVGGVRSSRRLHG